jgi:hypothetical protein
MAFERADRGAAASLRSPRFLPIRVDHLRTGRNHSAAEAMGLQIHSSEAAMPLLKSFSEIFQYGYVARGRS